MICNFSQLPLSERLTHYTARRAVNLDEDAISEGATTDPLLLSVSDSASLHLIMVGEEKILRLRRAERARRVRLAA